MWVSVLCIKGCGMEEEEGEEVNNRGGGAPRMIMWWRGREGQQWWRRKAWGGPLLWSSQGGRSTIGRERQLAPGESHSDPDAVTLKEASVAGGQRGKVGKEHKRRWENTNGSRLSPPTGRGKWRNGHYIRRKIVTSFWEGQAWLRLPSLEALLGSVKCTFPHLPVHKHSAVLQMNKTNMEGNASVSGRCIFGWHFWLPM